MHIFYQCSNLDWIIVEFFINFIFIFLRYLNLVIMILDIGLFFFELVIGIVYPLLMTIRVTVVSSEDYHKHLQSWVFYWVMFILLQEVSWYFDSFLWSQAKVSLIALLVMPQVNLSSRISSYLMGPVKTSIVFRFNSFQNLVKAALTSFTI